MNTQKVSKNESANMLNVAKDATKAVPATPANVSVEAQGVEERKTGEKFVLDLSYRGQQKVMTTSKNAVKDKVFNLAAIVRGWHEVSKTDTALAGMLAKIGIEKESDFKPVILFGRFYVDNCICRPARANELAKYKGTDKLVIVFAGGKETVCVKITESGEKLLNATKTVLFTLVREGFADDIKRDKEAREAARKAKKQQKKNK